jgi:hypothetical protein
MASARHLAGQALSALFFNRPTTELNKRSFGSYVILGRATAVGAVVVGAGSASALALEPACFSLLRLALLTMAATAIPTPTTMATPLLTAMALMAMGTVTMAMAATTRAIGTPALTPIVVITIGMVATTQIVGMPTVENRAALAHHRKTAVKAVFLFSAYNTFLRWTKVQLCGSMWFG